MVATREREALFLEDFQQYQAQLPGARIPWLQQQRREAIDRFQALGFPDERHPDWLFTSVEPIVRHDYGRPDPAAAVSFDAGQLTSLIVGGMDQCRLVFVDGYYAPALSATDGLPAGVTVTSLAGLVEAQPELVQAALGRYAGVQDQAFAALNTALWSDGAAVVLRDGAMVETPVHLVFVSSGGPAPAVAHPRILIVGGAGSSARIVESYAGAGEHLYWTNAVTEVVAGENSVIEHYKVQREHRKSYHTSTIQLHQARNSNVTSHSIALGGSRVRNDLNAVLAGEGAECLLNGLYSVTGRQHVDNHTCIDHAVPHCTSRELYKGVLDGRARAVFNGRVIVRPDAQKTDSEQLNNNLILSDDGLVNTKPELEIFNNDVKCRHGATIGRINEDSLFYARSRGIPEEAARRLLIYAFASEVIDRIRIVPLRESLGELLFQRLAEAS